MFTLDDMSVYCSGNNKHGAAYEKQIYMGAHRTHNLYYIGPAAREEVIPYFLCWWIIFLVAICGSQGPEICSQGSRVCSVV